MTPSPASVLPHPTATAPAVPARRAAWARVGPVQIALLGLATAVGPLNIDLYLPALPDLAAEFGVSPAGAQLSLTAALIGMALGQLVIGVVSDRLGRRVPLVASLVGFVLLALACAAAASLPLLVAARLGQGFLAGGAIVVCRAVLRDHVSGVALSRALAGLFLIVGVGPMLAPALGSLLLGVTGWRGVFVALAGFGLVAAATVFVWLPESLPRERRVRVSARGLSRSYLFLLRDRTFIAPALVSALTFAAMFAYISAGSFLLEEGFGLSQLMYGIAFGVTASCLILGSQISPRLIERVGALPVLRTAPIAAFVATLVLVGVSLVGWASLPVLLGLMMVIFLTMGIALPAGATMALSSQPSHRAGLASGLIGVVQFVIGGLAAPVVGLFDARSVTVLALVMSVCLAMAVLAGRLSREAPAVTDPRDAVTSPTAA